MRIPSCYANDNDAYIPERWAQEGLLLLEENSVAATLVHRDAIALVTRPLALPNQSMGVMAAVAAYNNIAMRVTMQARSPG